MSIEVTCPGCCYNYSRPESHKCESMGCECCGMGQGSRLPRWYREVIDNPPRNIVDMIAQKCYDNWPPEPIEDEAQNLERWNGLLRTFWATKEFQGEWGTT